MFFVYQLPICDLRDLINRDTCKLSKPDLLSIDPEENRYIRYFGKIKRKNECRKEWTDQLFFSSANNAIKFSKCKEFSKFLDSRIVPYERRLFINKIRKLGNNDDGSPKLEVNKVVSTLELGFISSQKSYLRNNPFNGKDLEKLIASIQEFSIKIRTLNNEKQIYKLKNLKKKVCRLYFNATTKNTAISENWLKENGWMVSPCNPIFVVEFNRNEIKSLPKNSIFVKDIIDKNSNYKNIKLFHTTIKSDGVYMRIWFIETSSKTNKKDVINLTSRLLSIHSEQQCLNRVLSRLERFPEIKRDTDVSEELQKYLDMSLSNLTKESKYGYPCCEISDIGMECEKFINNEEIDILLQRLKNIRGTLKKRVENYVRRNVDLSEIKKDDIGEINLELIHSIRETMKKLENDSTIINENVSYITNIIGKFNQEEMNELKLLRNNIGELVTIIKSNPNEIETVLGEYLRGICINLISDPVLNIVKHYFSELLLS